MKEQMPWFPLYPRFTKINLILCRQQTPKQYQKLKNKESPYTKHRKDLCPCPFLTLQSSLYLNQTELLCLSALDGVGSWVSIEPCLGL